MSATRRGLFFGLLGAPLALSAQDTADNTKKPGRVVVVNTPQESVNVNVTNDSNHPVYVCTAKALPQEKVYPGKKGNGSQPYHAFVAGFGWSDTYVDNLAGEWIHLTAYGEGGRGIWVHYTQAIWNVGPNGEH